MARKPELHAPEVCPVCGEEVPRNALACPECGADHKSGWRPDADTYDGLNLGSEEFDYDEFVREEFGRGARPRGITPIWWITGIVLIVALVLMYFVSR